MSDVFLSVYISKTVPITDLYDQYIYIDDVLYWLSYSRILLLRESSHRDIGYNVVRAWTPFFPG